MPGSVAIDEPCMCGHRKDEHDPRRGYSTGLAIHLPGQCARCGCAYYCRDFD